MTPWHCRECKAGFDGFKPECPSCKSRNSFAEGPPPHNPRGWVQEQAVPKRIGDVPKDKITRISTGTRELDRVLGGGIVPGGVVLFYADPGFGKSTLLMQVTSDLSEADAVFVRPDGTEEKAHVECLYITAEETEGQIKARQERVAAGAVKFHLFNTFDVSRVEAEIIRIRPNLVVIDSAQTMWSPGVDGPAGSLTQVRESAARIVALCKNPGIECAAFIVGHIIKDGSAAGPKTLEHLVDTVLEGTKEGNLRIVRANKNRFGDANEAAIFRMTAQGLRSVDNPVELMTDVDAAGTCLALGMLGRRAVCVEIQTLLAPCGDKGGKQFARGLSSKRLAQVMAVLRVRASLSMGPFDAHASIAGGLNLLDDAGLDFPLALALASSLRDETVPEGTGAIGEIGLAGELRKPDDWEARLKQARIMGLACVMGPVMTSEDLASVEFPKESYVGFSTIGEALAALGWGEKKKSKRGRVKR